MTLDELRLQYGTAVRPVDVVAEEVDTSPVVKVEAVQAPAGATPAEESPGGEQSSQRRRRRRRRGRRSRHSTGVTEKEGEGPHS
jgi:hypothetical protein